MCKPLQNWCVSGLIALALVSQPLLSQAQFPDKEAAKAAKITPDLLNIQQNGLPGNAAPVDGLSRVNMYRTSGNSIAIEAVAEDGQSGDQLLAELQALGLTQGIAYNQLIFGYLPIDKLGELKRISSLHIARPSLKPHKKAGVVTSQGDKAMRANIARQTYSVTGAGVKVGVLSDSYNSLGGAPAGVASGDLPANVQVIDDYLVPGEGEDEGRAMAEIIHDVAPGAAIAFNTAYNGQAGFAKGIRDLAAAGCKIITDDVGYFNEPFFQDGVISLAIRDVVNNRGVSYFTSAGNSERASYESPFVLGATISDPFAGALGRAHNFGGGDYYQSITIPARGFANIVFQWDDRFYSVNGGTGAVTDMDLLVFYKGSLRTDLSSAYNNLGDDPIEFTQLSNSSNAPVTVELALVRYTGPSPTRVKWINDNAYPLVVEYDTKSSSIFGHSNEATAISVGAAYALETPALDPSLPTALIEGFSTAGGTPILFNEAGVRLSAPVIRQKPEIVAPDGGSNSFFPPFPNQDYDGDGFPDFFGTSAAAPHAAAVAALMQEKANSTLSKSTILTIMEQTALDMDDSQTPGFDTGFDFLTGYGFIQADKALQSVTALTPTTFAITGVTGVSCATVTANSRRLTFTPVYSGATGQPITFAVVNETPPTTNPGPYSLTLYLDNPTITLKASQLGLPGEATFSYMWTAACSSSTVVQPPTPPTPINPGVLGITGVTGVSCTTVVNDRNARRLTFSPLYVGLNDQAITFQIVNETVPTTNPGPYTVKLYLDKPVITLKAVQAGTPGEATYAYSWQSACPASGARVGAEAGAGLVVRALGNPVVKETAEIEISGVAGQSVLVELRDVQGRLLHQQTVNQAGTTERLMVPVSGRRGMMLLNVGTANERKTIKLVKQ